MNSKRIEQTIALMERIRDYKRPFDMSVYYDGDPDDCGTAACMAGWMTRDRDMSAAGFVAMKLPKEPPVPVYGTAIGFNAVAKFLGIGEMDAYRLVSIAAYPRADRPVTPDMVIRRLNLLLAGKTGKQLG